MEALTSEVLSHLLEQKEVQQWKSGPYGEYGDNEQNTVLQNIINFLPSNMALDLIIILILIEVSCYYKHQIQVSLYSITACIFCSLWTIVKDQITCCKYSAFAIEDFIMSTRKHHRDYTLIYYTTYMSHLLHEPS